LLLKTPFRLVIGLFNNLQIVTTINYYNISGLHTLQTLLTNLFTLASVVFMYLQCGSYRSLCELHTPNITVPQYSQVLKSHNRDSLAGFTVIVHYRRFFFPRLRFAHYNCTRRLLRSNFTYCSAGFLCRCLLPVACYVLSESTPVSPVMSQWQALPRHRGGVGWRVDLSDTVAAAVLVTSLLAGEGVPSILRICHNILYIK
jgi:hypothetical protein